MKQQTSISGADTLAVIVFVLLFGLGMRESVRAILRGPSIDRPRSTRFATIMLEAGLFQTSFNAKSASFPIADSSLQHYSANPLRVLRLSLKRAFIAEILTSKTSGTGLRREVSVASSKASSRRSAWTEFG